MSGVPAVPFDLSARAPYARNAFDDAEYARRADAVRARMADDGVRALIVFGEGRSPPIEYLTGFEAVFGKHILLLSEDQVTLFTDGVLHGEPMHSMIWTCRVAEVVVSLGPTYGAPFDEVASFAAARLSAGMSVGVSDAHLMPRALWAQLEGSGANLRASDAVARARAIKSPAEVAVLKEACAIADRALTQMIAAIKPGKKEAEIGAIAAAIIAESGASEAFPTAVSSGHYAGIKHATPGQRVMEAGEPVFLDVGANLHGLMSDVSRCAIVPGTRNDEVERLYRQGEALYRHGLDVLRATRDIAAVSNALSDYARQSPFAKDFCAGGWGHGIGMALIEAPGGLFVGREGTLKPGMVIAYEPMFVVAGLGTGVVEDTFLVTDDGVEALSRLPIDSWSVAAHADV